MKKMIPKVAMVSPEQRKNPLNGVIKQREGYMIMLVISTGTMVNVATPISLSMRITFLGLLPFPIWLVLMPCLFCEIFSKDRQCKIPPLI